MSSYLLDTDTLIDFSKAREPVRTQLLELIGEGHEVAICPINEAEFYAGLAPEKREPSMLGKARQWPSQTAWLRRPRSRKGRSS